MYVVVYCRAPEDDPPDATDEGTLAMTVLPEEGNAVDPVLLEEAVDPALLESPQLKQ